MRCCTNQVFIFFLISVLYSVTWGIAFAMAAPMVITSQTRLLKIQLTRLVISWIFSALISIFFAKNFDCFWFGSKLNIFDIKLNFFDTKLKVLGTKLKFFGTKLSFFGCTYEPPQRKVRKGIEVNIFAKSFILRCLTEAATGGVL